MQRVNRTIIPNMMNIRIWKYILVMVILFYVWLAGIFLLEGETFVHSVNYSGKRTHLNVFANTTNTQPDRKLFLNYTLSEILIVRIYDDDKAKWTIKELKQWLHYLFFAGVQHVYICDLFVRVDERLAGRLHKYIAEGLVTYIPRPWNTSYNEGLFLNHQVNCYRHVTNKYGNLSAWQMSIDMDEYPFFPNDVRRGFLRRYLRRGCADCQTLMPNYLMLGQGDRSRGMVIERINRMVHAPPNRLTKPLYRPAHLLRPEIHSHCLRWGYRTVNADPDDIRMLHYWGARMQGWGPDTNESLRNTVEFNVVRDTIAPQVRLALLDFGESDAFSNSTGP